MLSRSILNYSTTLLSFTNYSWHHDCAWHNSHPGSSLTWTIGTLWLSKRWETSSSFGQTGHYHHRQCPALPYHQHSHCPPLPYHQHGHNYDCSQGRRWFPDGRRAFPFWGSPVQGRTSVWQNRCKTIDVTNHDNCIKITTQSSNVFKDPEDYNYLSHVFTWNFPEVKDVLKVGFQFEVEIIIILLKCCGLFLSGF